jgi:hypothetical protein
MRRRMAFACAVLAMATAISGTTAMAGGNGGFKTSRPSMLTAVKKGVAVTPLLTVGDELPNGFRSSRSRTGSRSDRSAVD